MILIYEVMEYKCNFYCHYKICIIVIFCIIIVSVREKRKRKNGRDKRKKEKTEYITHVCMYYRIPN